MLSHFVEYVAIANISPVKRDIHVSQSALETQVSHDGASHPARFCGIVSQYVQQIGDLQSGDSHPISITVKSNTSVGAFGLYACRQIRQTYFFIRRAAVFINVMAVGLIVEGNYLSTQTFK